MFLNCVKISINIVIIQYKRIWLSFLQLLIIKEVFMLKLFKKFYFIKKMKDGLSKSALFDKYVSLCYIIYKFDLLLRSESLDTDILGEYNLLISCVISNHFRSTLLVHTSKCASRIAGKNSESLWNRRSSILFQS